MEFVGRDRLKPSSVKASQQSGLPTTCLEGREINFYSESGRTGLYFLLLWGMKCPLTTLLCRPRMTQWPQVTIRGLLPLILWSPSLECWFRARIQKPRKLWFESWLLEPCCAFEQVIHFSGPVFSSCSNAADEPLCTVRRNVRFSKKTKTGITTWSSNSTAGCTPKRTENRISNRYLHIYFHSSIIHNSWKLEATQLSNLKEMDKCDEAYTCIEIIQFHLLILVMNQVL